MFEKRRRIILKKLRIAANVLAVLFFVFTILSKSMNLNPLYPETAMFYCFMITVFIVINVVAKIGTFALNPNAAGSKSVSYDKKAKIPKSAIIVLAIVWGAYGLVTIGSSVIFNVGAFRDQMPTYTEGNFTEDFDTIEDNKLPIVDKKMAANLADKKLGERPSLGSQVVLGEPVIQQVDGELIWAVPTYHSGFFKWITNTSGSPGYVIVSATNPQDVEYVDAYNIKYQPGAYFFDNLQFHARFSEAIFSGLTDYSFELDDTGRPYWVITTYSYTRGFALPEADGVLIMDCGTGETEKYDIDNIPDWVDRVQPENFITTQVNNKGKYVHGIFNFSDKDKYQTSPDENIIYINDNCYLFTGLTSVGSDESAIGFILVDMVTKEPIMYPISGATEFAAQKSAAGAVQDFGYYASFPLIVSFDDIPSYFMTLKDDAGLIKQYAYVSVEDYQTVAIGSTIDEAQFEYQKILRNNNLSGNVDTGSEAETVTSTVSRISQEFNGSQANYYVILDTMPDKIFIVPSTVSAELAITQPGDKVTVGYYDNASGVITAKDFDNKQFTQK